MSIRELLKSDYLDLVPVFAEMENYYFGEGAATKPQLKNIYTTECFQNILV